MPLGNSSETRRFRVGMFRAACPPPIPHSTSLVRWRPLAEPAERYTKARPRAALSNRAIPIRRRRSGPPTSPSLPDLDKGHKPETQSVRPIVGPPRLSTIRVGRRLASPERRATSGLHPKRAGRPGMASGRRAAPRPRDPHSSSRPGRSVPLVGSGHHGPVPSRRLIRIIGHRVPPCLASTCTGKPMPSDSIFRKCLSISILARTPRGE